MDKALDELDQAGGRMAGNLRSMISDGEDLLNASTKISDEGFALARRKFEQKLLGAKTALAEAARPAMATVKQAADVTDEYVQTNPWTSVGVAAAVGALLGFLLSRR